MELAVVGADGIARCWWCAGDPIYEAYHDQEWGRPIRDDQQLFALLMLEGFQAGLSWRTILHRRASFAQAFANWDPEIIAAYGAVDIERLMNDPGIIRNRLKVNGTVRNAQAYLQIRAETGSFADYIWSFVNGQTITRSRITRMEEGLSTTPESDAMAKALKKRGFTFV
ncbi:MAG TPA: DNA-3-methyladenine glycosylase I, partial [Thermomicrobiales bacterium]|nr:DNA-3-methyladenine glycosylase I [Thermomicrobiales bacterium]